MYQVVVVDDNPSCVEMITSVIDWDSLGCKICGVAYDGQKGKALISAHKPDIIISDIHMPGLNGLQMIELSKKSSPDSKVIFISAYDDFSYAQKAVKMQAFDYILKPFRPDDLQESVENVIRQMHPHVERKLESCATISEDTLAGKLIVDKMLEYLYSHIAENISLNELAEYFGYSPAYASSLIKKVSGRNFSVWLMNARMELAKRLLQSPFYRVEEVGAMIGYKNYISFYKSFVKEVGLSPSEYRKAKVDEK